MDLGPLHTLLSELVAEQLNGAQSSPVANGAAASGPGVGSNAAPAGAVNAAAPVIGAGAGAPNGGAAAGVAPPTTLIGLSVSDVRVMDEVGVMLSAENRVVVPRVAVS